MAVELRMDCTVFESPVPKGWVYPCTVADLRSRLTAFPDDDLFGLHAAGLVPSTKKNHMADGRYFSHPKPVIHIYSIDESLSYKQPPHVKEGWLKDSMAARYGMEFRKNGSRWICSWSQERLQRFILEYVVAHELGHHVYHKERYGLSRSREESEKFAESYAMRHLGG